MRSRLLMVLGAVVVLALLLIPQQAQTEMYQDDNQALKEKARPRIEAGLAFLKSVQARNGSFTSPVHVNSTQDAVNVGATALCGIAMLECDVPWNDPHVSNAAAFVRHGVDASGYSYNYGVTLSIMFLERLKRTTGKTNDDKLIQRLTKMVVNGQNPRDGGWGYQLTGNTGSDNSNTQFAVVALWLARKHNVPGVENALALAAQKFRKTQQQDGGWSYDLANIQTNSTGAMTCVGCLGIALHAGLMQQAAFRAPDNSSGEAGDVVRKLNDDPAIAQARVYLANRLVTLKGEDLGISYPPLYYLWSVERVCKLLHWKKINDVDWFKIGMDYLLNKQKPSGAWDMDPFGAPVSTAFALLFLAQSNLLGDLQVADFTQGALTSGPVIGPSKPSKAEKALPKEIVLAKDLAKKLVNARPEERRDILDEFELAKGRDYSYELAKAIPELPSQLVKDNAREVLAKRMMRLSVKTMEEYIKEEDHELRLAATRGAGNKNDKDAIPILIPLLEDRDVSMQDAALNSLRSLAKENFGKSVERWSRWYQMQKK